MIAGLALLPLRYAHRACAVFYPWTIALEHDVNHKTVHALTMRTGAGSRASSDPLRHWRLVRPDRNLAVVHHVMHVPRLGRTSDAHDLRPVLA